MVGFRCGTGKLACLLALLGASVVAQQSIPDAPQPKNTQTGQFPENAPPAPKNLRNEEPPAVASSTPLPALSAQPPGELSTDLKQFGTITLRVNFVQVPVIVRD